MKDIYKPKKKAKKGIFKSLFLFVLFLIIGFVIFISGYSAGQSGLNIGINLGPFNIKNSEKGKSADVDFSIFWQAWDKLNQNFISDLDPKKLVFGAISGLLQASGDEYTVFLEPDQNKRFRDDISGEFDGIGVEISLIDNMPTVVTPLSDSPAAKAGLKPKDIILEVDGAKTVDLGLENTIEKIRGEKGTKVTLKIFRRGEKEPLDISVVRETIKVASVKYEEKNYNSKKIAYIKIRQFGDDTSELFKNAVSEIKKSNPAGVVLDLRNNPGGYLEGAIEISSYFLDGGVIVSEVEKDGKPKEFKTSKNADLKDYKLVILVNDGSASASEIVAGAIKDRKRGKIFGQKTFGKGSVQTLEELSDGSALKITVAKWLTPNNEQINGKGIAPDVEVKDDENTDKDEALEKAMEEIVR